MSWSSRSPRTGWGVTVLLIALVAAVLQLPMGAASAAATSPDDPATSVVLGRDASTGMSIRRVTNQHGSMTYYVHRPSGLPARAPMVVHLHGGNMDARDAARKSRLNELADERGFIVVYPQEDPDNGRLGIWDWSQAAAGQLEDRAVSLVAALTRHATRAEGADPGRVFVSGISAGAGIAVVMAAVHPDLYRAIHAEVGCMFGCASALLGTPTSVSTLDPVVAGRNAYLAMGSRAARVPLLVSYGTLDANAYIADQEALVQQWQVTHDLVDDREQNGSVPRWVAATRTGTDGRTYSVDTYVDAEGCVLTERWLIDGLRHAYSGGAPSGLVDPDVDTGPNMRTVAYDFFLAQTAPTGPPAPAGGRCS